MEKLEKIAETNEAIPAEQGVYSEAPRGKLGRLYDRAKSITTNYLVDLSAGLLFYNPLMAPGERYIGDMETWGEVGGSRWKASIAQAVCMRFSGMLRNVYAEKFGLTEESPWYKKCLNDSAAILTLQIPAYSYTLYRNGNTFEEGWRSVALAAAITLITNNGTKISFPAFIFLNSSRLLLVECNSKS